jgi:hypothetical protein
MASRISAIITSGRIWIVLGLLLFVKASYSWYFRSPVIMTGPFGKVQRLDGDSLTSFDLSFFNPHASTVTLEVDGPECTAPGVPPETVRVPPFSTKRVAYPFDPTRLAVGQGRHVVKIHGEVGGQGFEVEDTLLFDLYRDLGKSGGNP